MTERAPVGRLILWDADPVLDWIQRNDTYSRFRGRAQKGPSGLSAQSFGEVLRALRVRPGTAIRLHDIALEIKEQFEILDLTADRAEVYAQVADTCQRTVSAPTVRGEAWFVWQVALSRLEDHRILTKAPQRYRGLVGPNDLA